MGVYIKDIKMPKECNYCACFSDEYWRCQVADYWERGNVYGERPDWCPLIEISTPHGRLIDADELKSDTEFFVGKMMMFGGQEIYSQSTIDNAPTIISAEDGGT